MDLPKGTIDTIIVRKSPYVIHNYVYISEKKKNKTNHRLKMEQNIGYFGGLVYYKNNYCNCPEYGDYLKTVAKNTKTLRSYEIGLNYNVKIRSIVTDLTIKYNSLLEDYTFNGNYYLILPTGTVYDSYTYKNTYNYLSFEAGIGYAYNIKKLTVNVTGRGSLYHLTHANAVTLDPEKDSVVNINSLGILRKDVYYLGGASKISYLVTENISLMLEPYYRLSLPSITKTSLIFPEHRHLFSLRVGIIHKL